MENQQWFKNWFNSPYYHQLYSNRNDKEAADFINKLIGYLQPASDSLMLDVACGKGRHSIQLAHKGFDVTGIDLSEESIADALKHQNEKLHFYVHDMRLPFYINYFNYVFNFFTSFGYFKTQREHDNALRTMAQSLQTGGILMIDFLNTDFEIKKIVPEIFKEINGVKYTITKWHNDTGFHKKILINDPSLKEPLIFEEKVSKFSLQDFATMFATHELQMKDVFGDYKLSPYNRSNSPRMIITAMKK